MDAPSYWLRAETDVDQDVCDKVASSESGCVLHVNRRLLGCQILDMAASQALNAH